VATLSPAQRDGVTAAAVHLRRRDWRRLVGDLEDLGFLDFSPPQEASQEASLEAALDGQREQAVKHAMSYTISNAPDGQQREATRHGGTGGAAAKDAAVVREEAAAVLQRILEPYVFRGGGLRSFEGANWGAVSVQGCKGAEESPCSAAPTFLAVLSRPAATLYVAWSSCDYCRCVRI